MRLISLMRRKQHFAEEEWTDPRPAEVRVEDRHLRAAEPRVARKRCMKWEQRDLPQESPPDTAADRYRWISRVSLRLTGGFN